MLRPKIGRLLHSLPGISPNPLTHKVAEGESRTLHRCRRDWQGSNGQEKAGGPSLTERWKGKADPHDECAEVGQGCWGWWVWVSRTYCGSVPFSIICTSLFVLTTQDYPPYLGSNHPSSTFFFFFKWDVYRNNKRTFLLETRNKTPRILLPPFLTGR